MKYLLIIFLLAGSIHLSCQSQQKETDQKAIDHEAYALNTFAKKGMYTDSVSLSFLGYYKDIDRYYPMLLKVNNKVYVPDTTGIKVIHQSPGWLCIEVITGIFKKVIIEEFEANAGDSIHIDVSLTPTDEEFIHVVGE